MWIRSRPMTKYAMFKFLQEDRNQEMHFQKKIAVTKRRDFFLHLKPNESHAALEGGHAISPIIGFAN